MHTASLSFKLQIMIWTVRFQDWMSTHKNQQKMSTQRQLVDNVDVVLTFSDEVIYHKSNVDI